HDNRDRRRLRLQFRRGRPRRLPQAVRPTPLHDRQWLLPESRSERRRELSQRQHRLGAGDGARLGHGQRHVPELQDHPSPGARGWAETVWSGAGSGCSGVYAKPSWQVNVTDGNCPNNRMEADVSAIADPNTGVAVYGPTHGPNRGWLVFGGTSVAAPLIGGIY